MFVSESLSITSFPSESLASVISAKFVNFLPNSAVSFTLHAIFTSLYDNVVVESGITPLSFDYLSVVTVLPSSESCHPYCMFVSCSGKNSNSSGNLSTI